MANLTEEQRVFVEERGVHCCTVAIPGSGKTTAIVHKVAAIVSAGRSVTAVSFTKQAATELRTRISGLVSPAARNRCVVGTFHSFVIKAMRERNVPTLENRKIVGPGEAGQFMKRALERVSVPETKESLRWFDACRSRVTDPFGLIAARRLDRLDPEKAALVKRAEARRGAIAAFEELMRDNKIMDFADVMAMALAEVRAGRPIFVTDNLIVDEAQDIDEVQFFLISAHADLGVRIDIVGDDDQSVYAFRQGMGYEGLERFVREVDARELVLSLNFRSRQEILWWAGQIVEQNHSRIPKDLVAVRGPGARLKLLNWEHGDSEQFGVARIACEAIQAGARSVAIIARKNSLLVDIQAPLSRTLTFRRINCDSFWESVPACVVLAFLRCLVDPYHEVSGIELMLQWLGASDNDIRLLREAAPGSRIAETLMNDSEDCLNLSRGGRSAAGVLGMLLEAIECTKSHGHIGDAERALEIVFSFCIDVISLSDIRSEAQAEAEINILTAAKKTLLSIPGSLSDRIRVVKLADSKDDEQASVTLVSMHSSKGMEFDTVIVIGVEDDLIPGRSESVAAIEEERRLLYVAMTRARDNLTITYARKYRAGRRDREARLCRFLNIPSSIRDEDATEGVLVDRLLV